SDRDRSPPMAAPRPLQDASQHESSRRCASGWVLGIDTTRLARSIQDREAGGLRQDVGETDPPTVSTCKLHRGAGVWPPPTPPNETKVSQAPCPPAGRCLHQSRFAMQPGSG